MAAQGLHVRNDTGLQAVAIEEIAAAADGALVALRQRRASLTDLLSHAAELERRTRALSSREQEAAVNEARLEVEERAIAAEIERARAEEAGAREELARERYEVDEAAAANREIAAALGRQATELRSEREQLRISRQLLDSERAELKARTLAFERRESRFHSRWRWLLRAWSWRPPLPGEKARLCELVMVPSSDGYKLLEQEGVALRRGSTLTGLLAEQRSFVVTKIAPWPFDGRWCAYLQQTS